MVLRFIGNKKKRKVRDICVALQFEHFGELVNIDGDLNSETTKDHNLTSGSKIITQTENGHEIHSQKEIKNNSSEKKKQN